MITLRKLMMVFAVATTSLTFVAPAFAIPWDRPTVSGWDVYIEGYIREFPYLIG